MAFTIVSGTAADGAAATGRPGQGHLQYAVNQGAYWLMYLTGTTGLAALYSSNAGSSWNAPSGSPYTLRAAHGSEGRNYGFGYGNLASTDVLHMVSGYSQTSTYHSRFTLGPTLTNTSAETQTIGSSSTRVVPAGCVSMLSSSGYPIDADCWVLGATSGNCATMTGSNADSGSSWTSGFSSTLEVFTTATPDTTSAALASLGSNTLLAVSGDASGSFTQLQSGSQVGGSTGTTVGNVFASSLTSADANAWGMVGRTTSDVHVLALSDNSQNYTHRRFNGSAWGAGSTLGTLAYGTDSGISLVSDGTSVWAAAIDSSKNIQYNQWTSGGGWGGWTVLEATRANQPSYITGVYNPAADQIMWAWTEANGSNFDIIGSVLNLGASNSPMIQPCWQYCMP